MRYSVGVVAGVVAAGSLGIRIPGLPLEDEVVKAAEKKYD